MTYNLEQREYNCIRSDIRIGRLVVYWLLKSCFSIATVLLKTIDDNLRERVLVVVTGE